MFLTDILVGIALAVFLFLVFAIWNITTQTEPRRKDNSMVVIVRQVVRDPVYWILVIVASVVTRLVFNG